MEFTTRNLAIGAAVALVAACLANLLIPTYPTFDTYANLVWGKALAQGAMPNLTEQFAPTPHPLEVALGVMVAPFRAGDRVVVVLVLAAFVALIAGVYVFAQATVGRWSAGIAAALVAVNPTLLVIAVRAGADVPFLAVVAWALAVEVREPRRRPRVVLGLLAVGGLLRPDAWGLAALYVAYLRWRGHVDRWCMFLLVGPPILCVALDTTLTRNPLHSLTWTTQLADALDRSRSPAQAPVLFVQALAHLLTPPVLALAAVGAVLASATRSRIRLELPAALFVIGAGAYLAIVACGFSAVDRYAWLAALPLTLAAGYALAGFTELEDAVLRRRWQALSAAAILVGAVGVTFRHPDFGRVHRELVQEPRVHDQYATLLGRDDVRAAARCGPVTVDGYYRIYETRWALDAPTAAVQAPPSRPEDGGVLFSTAASLRALPAAGRQWPRFVSAAARRETERGLSAYMAC